MSTKRLLLIDDEEDIREVVQMSLEMIADWEVLTASSGREGIAIAKSQPFDAILLDVMMPDLDGVSTFRQLHADPALRSIPVILLTAKAQSAEQRQFLEAGVAGVITKPFDPLTLADEVTEVLGW